MRAEYDFSGGVRGKYYQRYMESSNVAVVEPDVHKRFENSSAADKALRSLIRAEGAQRGLEPHAFRVFSPQGGHRKLLFMSELDVAKEKIAYLKVWLGILLVTDISTFGWLVSNVDTSTTLLLWAAVVVVVALTFGILFLHRRIDRHIQSLRDL